MRRFQGERIQSIMDKLNLPDDEKIEQSMVTKVLKEHKLRLNHWTLKQKKCTKVWSSSKSTKRRNL